MGLEINAYNLLRYATRRRRLGAVATIGRQSLDIPVSIRRAHGLAADQSFCEPLLMSLGATLVESFDVSDYEGATYVHDLNEPLSPDRQYDSVLDFGSLEHIYDQATAFENVRALCAPAGIVCHVLPANNLNGHGFWQYSSDLMHEIYSPENGFSACEIFYVPNMNPKYWYRAPRPRLGERIEIVSLEPVVLLSMARRSSEPLQRAQVYQRYYALDWSNPDREAAPVHRASIPRRAGRALKKYVPGVVRRLRNVHLTLGLATGSSSSGLSRSHPRLDRIRVSDFSESRASRS